MTRPIPTDLPDRCWSVIGVGGERSCGELAEYIHCRNCPVFMRAGRDLMEQEPPAGYVQEWTEFLAGARLRQSARVIAAMVFRLGDEWLALDAKAIGEIAPIRPAHSIAHRTGGALVGLVNIRGQLQLQVSLHKLLHLESNEGMSRATPRLVVIQQAAQGATAGATWVFRVDEILGVQRFSSSDVGPVPVTVAQGIGRVSRGLLSMGARNVGFLDSEGLFAMLRQAVG
ncbi:MAG TPA: chemotaxis protein CheW [Kofleriaceae bacterium]